MFQTSISKSDWQSLQKFNSAIKVTNDGLTKSQRITKAWNENMTGCSMTAKRMGNDLITGKQKIGDISNSMKTATASTKALEVAMNVFANVGFMLAITAVTKVVTELAQAQSKAVESAKEATNAYKDELTSLEEYKTKVAELHEELNSENISYEDSKTIREELLVLQDELIEKYGNEKTAIENITSAIKGEVDALDELNEKAYRDWLAKADEKTFWNISGKSGLDQAIDYMETDQTVSFFDMQNANLSDELQAIQKEIDETIRAKYGLEKQFATFKITGTPEEIRKQLEDIRQDYIDISENVFLREKLAGDWDRYREEAIDSINEVLLKLDDGLKKHQETYQTYIEGMIKYDSEYSDEYATILQKRAELESAQNSENEEAIQKARQAFMDAINKGIEESGSNENIRKYFESLYPELQAEFSSWNFEIALDANTDGLTDVANEIGEKYTATDLLGMVDDDSAVIADSAFNSLIDKAIEYGICTDKSAEEVQKLIDLLVELGIVQDNVKGDTETGILSFTKQISQVQKLSEGLDQLDEIYADVLDKEDFDYSSILNNDDFANAFSGYEDEYNNFIETITNSPNDINACQSAFNELATAYIYGSDALKNLTEETKNATIALLEQMGVANADEVVEYELAKAKAQEAIQTKENIEVTENNIDSLINEANASGITTNAYLELVAEEILFNNNDISTESKCNQILNIASAAGVATASMETLNSKLENVLGAKLGSGERTKYAEELGITVISEKKRTDSNAEGNGNLYVFNGQEFEDLTDAVYYKNSYDAIQNIKSSYTPITLDYTGGTKTSSAKDKSTSSSDTSNEKDFDWIETRLSRIQRAISNFGKTVSATYLDWSTRNKAIADEISSVNQELATQQNAYEHYMYEANKVGLSDYYKNLVQNGAIDISTITDETLQKQIETYQDYYNKALSASDAVQELKDSLAELAQTKLDNISKESENSIALLDHELSMLEAYTERLELQGYAISSKATEAMIKQNQEQLPILEKQYEDMQNALQNAIDTGVIKIYSDAWHEAVGNIQEVQESIEDVTNTIIELQNNLRELSWETFDKGQEHISNLRSEFDFLIDLLEGNKMYNDNGITEHGQATMGLHALNYNAYMSQADDYAEEIRRINEELADDPNNQTIIERRQELLELQRDMISAAEDEKQAMVDLASDGYDTLLDKIKEITEKHKDMLSEITDMRDFEKNVKEQVEELDSLKKQLIAYQGDDSESSRATIQELQDKIKDAEENLEETQYDKYIQDQEEILDKIYSDTEQWINERLDDEDQLLKEIIDSTNDSASSISSTISSSANEVGYTISNELGSILNGTGDLVAEYNDNFTNSMTTLQASVDSIKDSVIQMALNANAGFDSMNAHENTADSLSNMSAGWINNNGTWSYNRDGAQVKNEWIKDNGKWYHLNDTGVMDTNTWIQNDSGTWSYVDGSGAAVTGWQSLNWNGKTDWYSFDNEGTMKSNTWVGDYFVGEGGQMLTHTWVGHDGTYYYVGDDGKWLNLPGWSLNERPNDGYPIYEYAKGSKYIPEDQLALLGEKGQEMQYDTSEGVLKVVGQGDMVLTNEASKKLWEFSQDPKGYMAKLGFGFGDCSLSDYFMNHTITPNVVMPDYSQIPVINRNVQQSQPQVQEVNVTFEFPNVHDTRHVVNALIDDSRFEKAVKSMTLGSALGRNSLEKYNYKYKID